jgi:hypothetical protein
MFSVNLLRRVIGLFAIALGLFLIGFAIWLFRDTAGPVRRIPFLVGVPVTLGGVGITMVLTGVSLLREKTHRASSSAGEQKADE